MNTSTSGHIFTVFAGFVCVMLGHVTCNPVPQAIADLSFGDTSGETSGDMVDVASESVIYQLLYEVDRLYNKELVDESLATSIYLPRPGCPSINFNKESCRQKLIRGLQYYQNLLLVIKSEYSSNCADIIPKITKLILQLKRKPVEPESLQEPSDKRQVELQERFRSGTVWQKEVTMHIILRGLRAFLEDVKRAQTRMEMRGEKRVSSTSLPQFLKKAIDNTGSTLLISVINSGT